MNTLFAPLSHTPSLDEVLSNREARVQRQHALLASHEGVLISFSVNMPGAVKENQAAFIIFTSAQTAIAAQVGQKNLPILFYQEERSATGFEALYALNADAHAVKQAMVELEEQHPLGRLFDIDVIQSNGLALSRVSLAATNETTSARRCFICEDPAANCARSRQHSIAELHAWIGEKVHLYTAQNYN